MKLSLTTKIFLAFGFTLSLFAVTAWVSIQEFHAMSQDLEAINAGHLVLARGVSQLETHQQNRIRDLKRGFDDPDPQAREVILRIASAYFPEVVRSRVLDVSDVCRRQIARLEPRDDDEADNKRTFYRDIATRILALGKKHELLDELSESALARTRAREELGDLAASLGRIEADLRADTYQLNKLIDDETDRAVRRAERDEHRAVWRVIGMTVAALLAGIFLTLLSARALAPIRDLVGFARAISRGDYEQRLEMRGDDELSALAEELELMAKNRKEREAELDRQQAELERAYHRVADLKRYHESVVQSLRTAVLVTDRELAVTSANRAVEALGLADGAPGQRLAELPLGRELAAQLGPLDRLLAGETREPIGGVLLDGRSFEVSIAPFKNERGAVLGLVLAAEDVSEAVETKEALIRSERLAAIGRMSAHVTHEIRNPLSSIGLNAELLEDQLADPAAVALCRAIIREVDRLTAITEEYLRFARLPRPELRSAELAPLLASIADFVRRDCAAARVDLELELEPELPAVHIDPDQIRTALLNLVRNAKEAMPEGGTISIGARRAEGAVVLSVSDAGTGIAEEDRARIFDPFYSTKLTGTGLGLALVQQIVQEHGGRVEVLPRSPRGTELRLILRVSP